MNIQHFIPLLLCRYCQVASLAIGISHGQVKPDPESPDAQRKIEAIVDGYKKFDLQAVEKVVESFLKAGTVTERAKYVRDPKRVVPLMKKHYGSEIIKAEGLEKFKKEMGSYIENLLSSYVVTEDFTEAAIVVERITGKSNTYRVDWESWVGYCEMTVEEMKKARPEDPVMVRALLKRDSYFNYVFSDDEIWDSYNLVFKGQEESLAGYAKADSDPGKQLKEILKNDGHVPIILKISYPKNARSPKQVEIIEIISEGWLPDLLEEEEGE
ncbi:hypothetical protein OAE39_01265 [Akkermansiaceae bacterium]|nr:hypothetical protein [Akkermansiaceae bacterium]